MLTIAGFCSLIDRQTLLDEVMTSIEDLVSDTSQHVRAALGTQISGLAPILGKDEYVTLRLDLLHSSPNASQDHSASSANVFTNAERRIPRRPTPYHLQT